MRRLFALLLATLLPVGAASARLPSQAPPLPPPGPGLTIVNVSTAQQLANACWNLASNRAIVIAPGTYDLANVTFPNGVDGRLTIGRFGATPITNVQVRGATGNPADVVIRGAGMLATSVPFGMQFFTSTDVTIADLSLGNVYYHAIMVQGDQGAQRVRLYHVRLFDAGQQIVKGTTNGDDVVIEYSELYYTNGAPNHPEGSPPGSCYTNAVDGFGVDRWIVRDSLVRGIRCQDNTLAGPAILLWAGSSASLVERNTIIDSSRGISLGLGAGDHTGGIARNNFIRWNPSGSYAIDVPIYTTSPNAQLLHNTALTSGRYPNAIEVRFAGATNVTVRGNLADANFVARDGATPTFSGNRSNAAANWFADAAAGDLHLVVPAGQAAVDQFTTATTDDFDGDVRPAATNAADQGADELGPTDLLLRDGFE